MFFNECPHCKPVGRDKFHLKEKIGKLFSWMENMFGFKKLFPFSWLERFENYFLKIVLNVLNFFGIARFRDVREVDNEKIRNRSRVVVKECLRRGYSIRLLFFFGKETEIFKFVGFGESFLFWSLPLNFLINPLNDRGGPYFQDKALFKKFLRQYDYSRPKGLVCTSFEEGLEAGKKISKPLVVKPADKSLSVHVSWGIKNKEELKKAIRIAKKVSYKYIVEEQVDGFVHRALVVRGNFVSCVRKEPPTVEGDGKSSVLELIKKKNNEPERVSRHNKAGTLHKIEVNQFLQDYINDQGFKLGDIPKKGQIVELHPKDVLLAGADVASVNNISDKCIETLEKLSKKIGEPILGIDFIAENSKNSSEVQSISILEANNNPYIDMHHFPSEGKPGNVAKYIIDVLELKIEENESNLQRQNIV
ncbi:MAG: hypothetical protein ABEI53_02400 [Candidatus Magasanikbacteria bacterium]